MFTGYPKIIFVSILRCFESYTCSSKLDIAFGFRVKFNDALMSAATQIDQKMLTIMSCNIRDHFDFYVMSTCLLKGDTISRKKLMIFLINSTEVKSSYFQHHHNPRQVKARSHCDGNDIIFIILVSPNVGVMNGYCSTKWECLHDNGIFKAQNCRCCHSINEWYPGGYIVST